MKKFNFIEHTADIAVEVYGETLPDLFRNSAEAWLKSVLEETPAAHNEIKLIRLEASSCEELLVNFLNELNYFLLTKKWIFSTVRNLEIVTGENSYHLVTDVYGEIYVERKHKLKEEIKAVTYHQMKIERSRNYYKTLIVFDI